MRKSSRVMLPGSTTRPPKQGQARLYLQLPRLLCLLPAQESSIANNTMLYGEGVLFVCICLILYIARKNKALYMLNNDPSKKNGMSQMDSERMLVI